MRRADGLRMNNVPPGFIDSLREKDERRARIPMRRCGRAEEVAEPIAFLACGRAACTTGQNLRIDGGLTRSVRPNAARRRLRRPTDRA